MLGKDSLPSTILKEEEEKAPPSKTEVGPDLQAAWQHRDKKGKPLSP